MVPQKQFMDSKTVSISKLQKKLQEDQKCISKSNNYNRIKS